MTETAHTTTPELEAGLDEILRSPRETGRLELIVRRPNTGEREILQVGELDFNDGLVGDRWKNRGSSKNADGSANRDTQITIMNSRAIALAAREKARWPLAGDQLYVDLDLSEANLPPGTRLKIGSAILEVSAEPHTGCKKFLARFGIEALQFFNSPNGRLLRLRGMNARVVQPGMIRAGDKILKLAQNDQ